MRWLRLLHRYAGLAAALFLLLLAVSGGVLVFKDDVQRLRYPALRQPLAALTGANHAAAFTAVARRWPGGVRIVRTPRTGLPAYHVYLDDGEALLDQTTHDVIARWRWNDTPLAMLSELHMHLAAGDAGRLAVGWIGLGAAAMALSGVLLWWRVRRQYRLSSLWLTHFERPQLLKLHRDLGATSALLILLFALTGAGVVFGDASAWFSGVVLGAVPEAIAAPRRSAAERVPPPAAAMIARAQAALPSATLMSWSPPGEGSAVHYFRFRHPDEIHPYGRSTVYVDGIDGAVLDSMDITEAPLGRRAVNWLYPLHTAKVGGRTYRLLALATAAALAVMSVSGISSFLKSGKRR